MWKKIKRSIVSVFRTLIVRLLKALGLLIKKWSELSLEAKVKVHNILFIFCLTCAFPLGIAVDIVTNSNGYRTPGTFVILLLIIIGVINRKVIIDEIEADANKKLLSPKIEVNQNKETKLVESELIKSLPSVKDEQKQKVRNKLSFTTKNMNCRCKYGTFEYNSKTSNTQFSIGPYGIVLEFSQEKFGEEWIHINCDRKLSSEKFILKKKNVEVLYEYNEYQMLFNNLSTSNNSNIKKFLLSNKQAIGYFQPTTILLNRNTCLIVSRKPFYQAHYPFVIKQQDLEQIYETIESRYQNFFEVIVSIK